MTNPQYLCEYQKRVKIKYQKQVEKWVSYAGFSADSSAASIAFDWSRSDRRCSWGGTPATRFTAERNQMKDKKMSIRISEDDLKIIHYKAEQAKLTLTEYVTQCSLSKQIFVIDGLDEVIRQQKAIGKNLNRLTVLSNMGKLSSVNLEHLTEEYAVLNRTLTELLDRKRWSA